jgi:phage FluMu gp28-like protein
MTGDARSTPSGHQANRPLSGVIKRNEQELRQYVIGEEGFISTLCRFEDELIQLEPFQRGFLRNTSRFRWVTKSRQVGFSFITVLEALARCHLRESYTAIFVSFALDESKDRILLARQVYEDLPNEYKKKLIVDSKTELAFESNASRGKISRLISVPSKAPRGKRGDIVLDELAHYVNDREVYTGSTAVIMRSHGQLTGCSTPLGRRGIFWEIASEEIRKYPTHTRQLVPWWLCRFFCTDVERAIEEAPDLPSQEAVERFGTATLIEQFESLPLEDFEQEFACRFVDESYSWFPYDIILPCTSDELHLVDDPSSLRKPEGRLVAGFDVGRHRDRSELAVFEEQDERFTCRLLKTFNNVPFAEQEAELRRLLETVPIARLSIDRGGIGMNLSENLARDYPQVVGENFSNESKERWATDFKILLQRRNVVLPRQRELVGQLHSIKRRVLPSGKIAFEAERTDKGHADKFWAVALACQMERSAARRPSAVVTMRVVGEGLPSAGRATISSKMPLENQAFSVGLSTLVLVREVKLALAEAFPGIQALMQEEAVQLEPSAWPPIVFSYAYRPFESDFPVRLEFERFPESETSTAVARRLAESLGCRAVADPLPETTSA